MVQGLGGDPKRLPSKYFYDERGSMLFEAICELPEYYPTRQELGLLEQAAPEIARYISPRAALIEFGSGASVKTRLLLDAAPQVGVYIPMDISEDALEPAAAAIRWTYPNLVVAPLVGDFTRPIHLPPEANGRPRTGFFPGSTIGNFMPADAVAFLKTARRLLGEGAQFIVGADLVKDEAVLVAAYDDARGVTADFNLNLLKRINRELDGDIDLAAFSHRAVWNARESRMEMHLVSQVAQSFHAAGRAFSMAAGETIHTENSYKYTLGSFRTIASQAGWRIARAGSAPTRPSPSSCCRTSEAARFLTDPSRRQFFPGGGAEKRWRGPRRHAGASGIGPLSPFGAAPPMGEQLAVAPERGVQLRAMTAASVVRRRPPPWEASPPLRPALAARSRSWLKLRLSSGTLAPPFRAISRWRSLSMAAKPRRAGLRVRLS